MGAKTDTFDLAGLRLTSGEGRRHDLLVQVEPFELSSDLYTVSPVLPSAILDISKTTGGGYALRLRFAAELDGPCMRCLETAHASFRVDAREISQPAHAGDDDDLESEYITDGALDIAAWARDALALTFPAAILCRSDCAGLCPVCGTDLNAAGPEHSHDVGPDPRWSKLSELKFDS